MLKINLLQKLNSKGKEVYIATEKGLDFLQRQCELNELLQVDDGKPKNGVKMPPKSLFRKS
jgi:hypothetical protein